LTIAVVERVATTSDSIATAAAVVAITVAVDHVVNYRPNANQMKPMPICL